MKRLYERVSRRCAATSIDMALRAEIADHAEANQLGDVIGDALACCDTRSVRLQKPGLLLRLTGSGDPDPEHRTIVLVTRRYLVVLVTGEKRGTHVRSARLDGLSVGTSPLAAELDSGVSATGLWSGDTTGPASFFIGLGDDEPGKSFLADLQAAIIDAKA